MKVAITGNAGFIGSNLTEACLKKEWNVIGIDNFSTGFSEMANPERYSNMPGKYDFVKLDILETSELKKQFKECDVIFHLAALPRVSYSTDYPIESNKANIDGTLSVLEAAKISKVRRVVFSCSSSVYGGVACFPTQEEAPTMPKSNYALHKQTGAEYCRLYSELYKLDTISLLYFNVFGQHQRANSAYATVIPAFFDAAVNQKPCRIDGDGNQSRDFCHVDNVVEANILAALSPEKFSGNRFNIACGETHTINEVFEQVQKLMEIELQKTFAPERLGDPKKSHAHIGKAEKILGYFPKINFIHGMQKTAEWWKGGCKI